MSDSEIRSRIEAVRQSFTSSQTPTDITGTTPSPDKPNSARPQRQETVISRELRSNHGIISHEPSWSPQSRSTPQRSSPSSGLAQPSHGIISHEPSETTPLPPQSTSGQAHQETGNPAENPSTSQTTSSNKMPGSALEGLQEQPPSAESTEATPKTPRTPKTRHEKKVDDK